MATSMLVSALPLPRCQRTFRVVSARAPSKHSNAPPSASGPPPDMSYVLRSKGGSGYGILKILVRDKPHVTLLLAARLPPGSSDPADENDEESNNSPTPVKRSEKKTAWLWARFHPRSGAKPPGAPLAPPRPLTPPNPNATEGSGEAQEDVSDRVVIKVRRHNCFDRKAEKGTQESVRFMLWRGRPFLTRPAPCFQGPNH